MNRYDLGKGHKGPWKRSLEEITAAMYLHNPPEGIPRGTENNKKKSL